MAEHKGREKEIATNICIMVPLTTQDVLKRVVTANSLKFFFGKTIYGRIKTSKSLHTLKDLYQNSEANLFILLYAAHLSSI